MASPRARSMQRLMLGYAPANLVPAAVSIAGVYVFTRLLGPQQFGAYSLAFSVLMVAQSVLFFAPALAVTRFYAVAEDAAGGDGGGRGAFLRTMYGLTLAIGLFACLLWLAWTRLAAPLLPGAADLLRQLGDAAPAILPLLLLRALVATNQTVNRAAGRMLRFNLIECLHAVLGLAAGIALVWFGPAAGLSPPGPGRSGGAVMLGLLAGAACCAAIDARLAVAALWARARIDRALLAQLLRFMWPLVLAFVVGAALQYADRFVVDSAAGAAALGVYVVAFSLADRPITLICLSVTAATFQLAVDTYVRDGAEAGRLQAGRNGAVLLGLALPAGLGLMLTAPLVAAVMVGPAFRGGVALLLPIMAATAVLRGAGAHYVDHAFHLANRSFRLFGVYLPSAAANVVFSLLLVPRYGMVAAAYVALGCQAVALLAGWLAARKVLPLWLPGREMAKLAACLAAMAATLLAVPLPAGRAGLAAAVALGAGAYAGGALALDLGGLRGTLRRRLRRRAAAYTG